MKWAKRQVAVWEISETGRTTEIFQAEDFDEAKKSDLALCFFG